MAGIWDVVELSVWFLLCVTRPGWFTPTFCLTSTLVEVFFHLFIGLTEGLSSPKLLAFSLYKQTNNNKNLFSS